MRFIKKTGLVMWCCMAAFCKSYGKENVPLIKVYVDAMRQLSHNCSMDYTMSYLYPDKTKASVAGRMAISQSSYYDSSNARFVMMNRNWLILAQHQERLIDIIYLPEWRKKMGKDYELDISGYLLGNTDLEDFSGFKVSPAANDSFKVTVSYNTGTQAIDLVLHYVKGSLVPARYEGVITYAIEDEDQPLTAPPSIVKVSFECHNIQQSANAALFDDSRLIKTEGGKARMKRFNDYKMYRRTS